MLSLAKVGRGAIGYYFAAVGPTRAGLVEAEGRWLGSLAASLQLGPGAVEESALRALLEGVDPTSGEILDPQHVRVRVVAYDAVFAAPKSVSVLHALAAPEVRAEIGGAHEASVAAVVAHLEPTIALVRRRGPDGRRSVAARGLAAAAFVHRTSRAPDPHLHSHVVLANLASDPNGAWSALDGRALFEQRRVAGALYGAELRRGLADRLGLEFHLRRPGVIDVVGFSDTVITAFSRRLAEIEAARADDEVRRGRAARFLADRTRPPKDLTTSYETLVDRWREEAYRLGVSDAHLALRRGSRRRDVAHGDGLASVATDHESLAGNTLDPARRAPHPPEIGAAIGAALGSFDLPFLRRELVAAIATRVVEGARTTDLEAATDATLESVAIDPTAVAPTVPRLWSRLPPVESAARYVTREAGTRLRETAAAIAAAPHLGQFVSLDRVGSGLVREQPHGLVAGPRAGALDTLEMLRALATDARDRGRRVVGVAPHSALAAHLQGLTGIVATVAETMPLPRQDELVVVFGASRLAPRAQAALIGRAQTTGSAVVVVDVGATALRQQGLVDTPLVLKRTTSERSFAASVSDGGVRSLFASRLVDLAQVLETACADVQASHRHPVIVLTDRGLGEELGMPSVGPGAALRLERSDPGVGLVLVGGRDVLPEQRDRERGAAGRSVVGLAGSPERIPRQPILSRTTERGHLRDRASPGRSIV